MSIFKDSFKAEIREQITRRQNIAGGRTRSPQELAWLNSRNAWIRMTSSVQVNGDAGALARQYILQGGTRGAGEGQLRSGIGGNSNAYSTSNARGQTYRLGIRPMPGITGIDVKSKSAYGSLREVTVQFNAWDIRQLEELELLYMRPGYTVLVEWGWSPYINNAGALVATADFTDEVLVALNGTPNKDRIQKLIYEKALRSNGNYDASYGKISNYSWKARMDGGYDCSVTITSLGEILESLKINYGSFESKTSRNGVFTADLNAAGVTTPFARNSNIASSHSQNLVAGILNELYNIVDNALSSETSKNLTFSDGETYSFYKYDISITDRPTTLKGTDFNDDTQIYITLESFIRILNKYILLSDTVNNNALVEVSLTEGNHMENPGQPLLCLGDAHQISTNPFICLINNPAYTSGTFFPVGAYPALERIINSLGKDRNYWFNNEYTSRQLGVIGNIYVNIAYMYSLVVNKDLESQDKKEKNDIAVFDFIKNIMNGISTAIGNVSTFDVFVDPIDSKARIIDVNYVDQKSREDAWNNCFTIDMHSLTSTVRSYSFESQIFPEQSTMIAIGAQAEGGALGENVNTLVDYNQNLVDRVIPRKTAPTTPAASTSTEKETNLKNNLEILTRYFELIEPDWWETTWFWWGGRTGDFKIKEASKYSNALKDIINYYQSLGQGDNTNKAIIPTKLSFDMDGVGGIIIGNLFRIPLDLLPRGYRGEGAGAARIAYTVNGLSHTVKDNDWVTSVEAQFILLDNPGTTIPLSVPSPSGESIIQPPRVGPSSTRTATVRATVFPGSIKARIEIVLEEAPSVDVTINCTISLDLVAGGTLDVPVTVVVKAGSVFGYADLVLSTQQYDTIKRTGNVINAKINSSDYVINAEPIQFLVNPPTKPPTPPPPPPPPGTDPPPPTSDSCTDFERKPDNKGRNAWRVGAVPYDNAPTAKLLGSKGYKNARLPEGANSPVLVPLMMPFDERDRRGRLVKKIDRYNTGLLLAKKAAEQWEKLMQEAKAAGFNFNNSSDDRNSIFVSSAYRNLAQQPTGDGAAKKGFSPHGWGGAVDIRSLYYHSLANWTGKGRPIGWECNRIVRATSPLYKWLDENGPKYCWFNPWRLANYGGIMDEAWHFEYWGPAE